MILLVTSTACSANGGVIRIPKGWTAPYDGYFLTEPDLRDTISGWTYSNRLANLREQTIRELHDEIQRQSEETARLLTQFQRDLDNERSAYRHKIRQGRTQGFTLGLIIGLTFTAIID